MVIEEMIAKLRAVQLNGWEQSKTDAITTEIRQLFEGNGITQINRDHLHGAMIALQAAVIASPKVETVGEHAVMVQRQCNGFVLAAVVRLEVAE